ncbi:MAG: glycosyltransferase family A protein [Lacunisphaera sp.]
MPETGPKISVLVPTYNYARFLPQAIESILAQTDADFEVFISDDASTDDSAEVIRHYAARDSRIRFALHPNNLGMVANWNWCLQQAHGEYVKYLFGDDLLTSPEALARMADLLDQQPDAALVASARVLLDQNSRITGFWDHLSGDIFDGPHLISRCLRTRRNVVGEPSAVMFRRPLANRGFDPAYRQIVDLEMWFHLMAQGALCHTPELLCGFRQHADQQTVVNGRNRVTDLELIDLLDRYQSYPEVRTHLQPNSWAHRWILYRQLHYARKATDRAAAASAVLRLERQIPPYQRAIYWVWHRMKRPPENFFRKATQGVQAALSQLPSRAANRTSAQNFICSLEPSSHPHSNQRTENRQLRSIAKSNEIPFFQAMARALQQKLPRQITAGLMIVGIVCAAGIPWARPINARINGSFFSNGTRPFYRHHFRHWRHHQHPNLPPFEFPGERPPNKPFPTTGNGGPPIPQLP